MTRPENKMDWRVTDLRCEYVRNPLGIGEERPRFSWTIRSGRRFAVQTAYRLQVAEDASFEHVLWDSGKVESGESIHVTADNVFCRSCFRYYYRVEVWGRRGERAVSDEESWWETGILDPALWQARWISASREVVPVHSLQSPMFRREVTVDRPLRRARLYITARGLYRCTLNGAQVGDGEFTPGWTSYRKRLQVQTHDVTPLLQPGENAIGVMLGDGWYRGSLTWDLKRNLYGDRLMVLAQLHLVFEDGSEQVIGTDASWLTAASPVLMSELYHGETYDARLEQPGWDAPGFDAGSWKKAEECGRSAEGTMPAECAPVKRMELLRPVRLLRTPRGETVLDFGQNLVGRVRFSLRGEAGRTVVIDHAEVLDKDGNFYTDNMRKARNQIRYVFKGDEVETYEPHFTYQGFRYVRLTGFPEPIAPEQFCAVVMHTDMERTGSFACSEPLVNRLHENIVWSLKGNFFDVPTDCPQRDERLGWTGDAQMFLRTAASLYQAAPFFTKWLHDLRLDQREDGGVPVIIPDVLDGEAHSAAGWSDAAVIVPWTLYLCYGDVRILERQYDSMRKWAESVRSQGDDPYLWNTGYHYGDWLGLDSRPGDYSGATDKDFVATAFYAHSVSLLRRIAAVLGRREDASRYAEWHRRIVRAFRREFVTPAGRLAVPTQTAHVLALAFGLVGGKVRERAIRTLAELIEKNNGSLSTGIIGSTYLNPTLSECGLHALACRLLLNRHFPSWLHPVTLGATTIWEHWDGIREDGSFWSPEMNSFNHYAYGAIGEWLYRYVAGIDADERFPGYKRIRIHPRLCPGLAWAEARLATMYGQIVCRWERSSAGEWRLQLEIPGNCTASVTLPMAAADQALEGGIPLAKAAGLHQVRNSRDGASLLAGSGTYCFTWMEIPV